MLYLAAASRPFLPDLLRKHRNFLMLYSQLSGAIYSADYTTCVILICVFVYVLTTTIT